MDGPGIAPPRFFLYGEPPRVAPARFLHLEPLARRSRRSGWRIRPHLHVDLHQIFLIDEGRGVLRADAKVLAFAAPCLLVIPAGCVHGLEMAAGSAGTVLTLGEALAQDLLTRAPELSDALAEAARVEGPGHKGVGAAFGALCDEFAGCAPGRAAALESGLLALLVSILRALPRRPLRAANADAALVASFRRLLDEAGPHRRPVNSYAADLHVTPKRLRLACARTAGMSPKRMILNRVALEAQRLMLFSPLSAAQIAYELGFSDPAYFSRFFRKATGTPPRHYRRPAPDSESLPTGSGPSRETAPGRSLSPPGGPARAR